MVRTRGGSIVARDSAIAESEVKRREGRCTMNEPDKFRYRVKIDGVEVVTDHSFTKEEVQDIHRVTMRVAQIAAGDETEVKPGRLEEHRNGRVAV